MKPASEKWWDTCIKPKTAPFYYKEKDAQAASEKEKNGRVTSKSKKLGGYFIWGDRVTVVSGDPKQDRIVKVAGRGRDVWIRSMHLGGDPLLELYVIDVGQGDGLLVVSPEGHHIMVDGGNRRFNQNGGKNAADFVDWKFFKDYLRKRQRSNTNKTIIKLDAMIASHNDVDHFGGLLDLLNFKDKKNDQELDCTSVQVDNFYHAGLSWWFGGRDSSGGIKRSLGRPTQGFYTKLLGDRRSAENATKNLDNPDHQTLNGSWGKCIAAAVDCVQASDPSKKTNIERLSTFTHDWLPGFSDTDTDSDISIRVLGPISETVGTKQGLKKFPDGDSKNTNGHSVVLRIDYGKRKLLLTGDLNTHSQNYIMEQFGADFSKKWKCDVAKGCHHGSHDVSYKFLAGLEPVATVISSGDAETYDHPRPTIVSASAITGRKLWNADGTSLIMPLVFMTEISRSYDLKKIHALHEFNESQPEFSVEKPKGDKAIHNTITEKKHFRTFLVSSAKKHADWPRLDNTMAVRGLVYGLVNVRTDGKDLMFAAMEEMGKDWSVTILKNDQISAAKVDAAP